MTDNLFSTSVFALISAMSMAAAVSTTQYVPLPAASEQVAAAGADVVHLPTVTVNGRRQQPDDEVAVAANVVRLPTVTVNGRRQQPADEVVVASAN